MRIPQHKLDAALAARKRFGPKPFILEDFLFKEQLEFVKDPARFAMACCSVRAGKSVACCADLINTALTMPGTIGCYITLARSSAERIVWPELKNICRTYRLRVKVNESKLSMVFPGGSTIYLLGANDEKEIEKIRGLSNVSLVYLDEAQLFRHYIKELVEDIVTKRLYDTNGRCRMIGTPGPILDGYFYKSSQSPGWSHHHWDMRANPWLLKKSGKTPDELIAQDCLRQGIGLDDPSIQRECFGVWKHDPNALLLHYTPQLNDYRELPPGNYTHICGIDLGHKDSDSISIIGWTDASPITYLIEEQVTAGQTDDALAAQLLEKMQRFTMAAMPTDTGGLGKKIVESLKARYGIPLIAAEKTEKMANYKRLDNALRNGTFKAKASSRFAQDCAILSRDLEKSTPERVVVKGHSDSVDSVLYAFKLSPAYTYVPKAPSPTPGTPEHDQEAARALFEHNRERFLREKVQKDSQGGVESWKSSLDANGIPSWLKYND